MTIICATHSYRGGTGKSNVTANLGVLLAQSGRRVAVVDTDVPSPGIHVIFGLDPSSIPSTLNNYLYGTCNVEDAAVDVGSRLVDANDRPALHGGSLHLVPSSVRSSDISRIVREGYDVNRLSDGFYELIDRLKLDVLLIDTHPGLNEETLLSIAIADHLLLIVRPDNQDLQGTAVTVEVARKLEVLDMRVILNKVPAKFDEDDVRQKVERAFGVPVTAVLPLSTDMAENASSSVFVLSYPDHALTQRLKRLAQTLTV
jgi:MinD-like ATPase involved in chromosome partitioning or flagellar assembly